MQKYFQKLCKNFKENARKNSIAIAPTESPTEIPG